MKINVFGATPSGTAQDKMRQSFNKLTKEEKGEVITFPERYYLHPKSLDRMIRDNIHKCIMKNENMTLLTYSEYALNAVRIFILKSDLEIDAKVYQYTDDKESIADINKSGNLSYWESGVYDFYDDQLDELLGLDTFDERTK